MGAYLQRWGFTPQKPRTRAYEQSPAAVQRWLADTYPTIAREAKTAGAEIFWGDQTGLTNQPNAPRGYAPRGQTPVVRLNRIVEPGSATSLRRVFTSQCSSVPRT